MMKVFWVSVFLLTVTYAVSSKTINCYVCEEYIDDSSVQKLFDFQNLIEICADPITNSTTETVDSDKYNCAKIDIKIIVGGEIGEKISRETIEKGTCPDIVQEINYELSELGIEGRVNCTECVENLCNA